MTPVTNGSLKVWKAVHKIDLVVPLYGPSEQLLVEVLVVRAVRYVQTCVELISNAFRIDSEVVCNEIAIRANL